MGSEGGNVAEDARRGRIFQITLLDQPAKQWLARTAFSFPRASKRLSYFLLPSPQRLSCLEPPPDRGCVRRTSRSKCGCPESLSCPKTPGLAVPLRLVLCTQPRSVPVLLVVVSRCYRGAFFFLPVFGALRKLRRFDSIHKSVPFSAGSAKHLKFAGGRSRS